MAGGSSSNPLVPPSVVGLDGGRKQAGKQQRRTRRRQTVSSFVLISVGIGVVAAAGYVGYEVYVEQQESDRIEREVRQAEIEAERRQRTTTELIVDLEERPRWNGPGAPAFGVGEGEADVDAIVVTEP